ncbi:MAG TPA: hypothetical protein ENK91_12390 [Bacteroidetes bacterium]|nr:hypothetical protein [Bacteroidota bacterium]
MKSIKLLVFLFVLHSHVATSQVTDKELQSPETISFITDMVKDESVVFGKVSKSNDGWSIEASTDKKVVSFMFADEIYKSQQTDLKVGLEKIIAFLISHGESCYEYVLSKENQKWDFFLYRCN